VCQLLGDVVYLKKKAAAFEILYMCEVKNSKTMGEVQKVYFLLVLMGLLVELRDC
jgi:hypothetical protein